MTNFEDAPQSWHQAFSQPILKNFLILKRAVERNIDAEEDIKNIKEGFYSLLYLLCSRSQIGEGSLLNFQLAIVV